MAQLTFYPIGNADTTLIDLENGDKVLFDFADMKDHDNPDDKRCDLSQLLRTDMSNSGVDQYHVVAFSHLDEDHYKRSSEFFWLRYDSQYQGKGRIKFETMWVPAYFILEENIPNEEGKIIQAEARYRFKKGTGIRVFSRPEKLKKWCKKNDVDFEKRKHLVTDAGNTGDEITLDVHGAEFFCHSPFAKLVDGKKEDRNDNSLVMQAKFVVDGVATKFMLMADIRYGGIDDIVEITEAKGNQDRLEWDGLHVAHHCSRSSVGSGKERTKSKPSEGVKKLMEEYRQQNGILICPSWPIPEPGSSTKKKNPPYRQAANFYKEDVVDKPSSQFLVTMEQPSQSSPKPIVLQIDRNGITQKKTRVKSTRKSTSSASTRVG